MSTKKARQPGSSEIPVDATYPTCQVLLKYNQSAPLIDDEDITQMIEWFYVVEYSATE